MFVQSFRSYFSEEIFYDLCLNGSVYKHAYVSKHTKTHQTDQSNQNHNKGKNKKERNIYIIYKDGDQAKYLFRTWPFTG